MSSISDNIAKNIIKNNGVYITADGEKDPPAFAVFRIQNRYFSHVHYVVAYTFEQYMSYAVDHKVVEINWCADKEKVDTFNFGLKEFGL